MYKKNFFVYALCTLLLCGCSTLKNENDIKTTDTIQYETSVNNVNTTMSNGGSVVNSSEDSKRVMIEDGAKYLVDNFSFTEEELSGIDATAFANDYLIEELTEEEVRNWFELVRDHYIIDEDYVYRKMVDLVKYRDNTGKITRGDVVIKVGCLYQSEHSKQRMYVYDLQEGVGYLDEGKATQLSDSRLEDLNDLVYMYDIDIWENEFVGSKRNTTSYYHWEITFQLIDGSYRCYKGTAEFLDDFDKDAIAACSSLMRN